MRLNKEATLDQRSSGDDLNDFLWNLNLFTDLFKMYDMDEEGVITRKSLEKLCIMLYKDCLSTKSIKRITDISMLEMDTTNSDQIYYEDFKYTMMQLDVHNTMIVKFE